MNKSILFAVLVAGTACVLVLVAAEQPTQASTAKHLVRSPAVESRENKARAVVVKRLTTTKSRRALPVKRVPQLSHQRANGRGIFGPGPAGTVTVTIPNPDPITPNPGNNYRP
ncbi:hypothetical protein BV898_10772 [Hypsibius exemplaris]|uniref:Uncharacterized protein n=1 Tax=Hypsibius exemplaris TaxID=2072580 RepID=A0A1W0WIL8_HYPEX|nr:hypothetical protein BV898_10772 [Hypsibius exemplaris]